MKKLSITFLADTVVKRRKAMNLTQTQLSKLSGINRSILSNLESMQYTPSIEQLQALASVLGFEPTDMFVEQYTIPETADNDPSAAQDKSYNVAIAGTGYVGLSLAGVMLWGLEGVVTGTLAAMVYQLIYMAVYDSRLLSDRLFSNFVKLLLMDAVLTGVILLITSYIHFPTMEVFKIILSIFHR